MSAQQAAASDDDVVPNLHQIVHLCAIADARIAPRAAVDARVGAQLDVVAKHHAPLLRLLGQLSCCWVDREAEAVRANLHAVVQRAARAHSCVRDGDAVAHLRALAEHDARPNHAARAHAAASSDTCAGKHDRAGLYDGARINRGVAVNEAAAI